jgi:hypothetical protein
VTIPLWVHTPESLPTKVRPPIYVCLIKWNPRIPVRSPKLRRNPVSDKHNPCYSIGILLLSPKMRSHAGMAKQKRGRRLALGASLRPLVRLLVGCAALAHRPTAAHAGELDTSRQLLQRTAGQTLRVTVVLGLCALGQARPSRQHHQPPLLSQYPFGPFQGPTHSLRSGQPKVRHFLAYK